MRVEEEMTKAAEPFGHVVYLQWFRGIRGRAADGVTLSLSLLKMGERASVQTVFLGKSPKYP